MPLEHHASIWTGLYRREFIIKNNIRVLEKNKGRYADQNWRYETLMLAKSIYWENKSFYNYRLTNENASSFKKNNPDDIFDIYEELYKFLKKHPQEFEQIKEHLYIEIYRHMFWNLSRVDEKYKKYCEKRIHDKFKTMDINTVVNSTRFTDFEKKQFLHYHSSFYKCESYKRLLHEFVQTVFSIKNSKNKKHNIITLLGLKMKVKRKSKHPNKR
jgi:hypothetical protein